MYVFRVLLISFFIPALAFGQTITVSEDFNLRSDFEYDILGKYGEEILFARNGLYEFDVQSFDKELFATWEAQRELDTKRDRIFKIIGQPDQNVFHVIYSTNSKDTFYIKQRMYDQKANLILEDTIIIAERTFFKPSFRFNVSENNNLLLISELSNQSINSLTIYDLRNHRLVWYEDITIPKFNFREEYRKTIVTDKGDVLIVFEENNQRFKQDAHKMEIFIVSDELEEIKKVEIGMPDYITHDAIFKYDNKNEQLAIVGVYSSEVFGASEGLFFTAISRYIQELPAVHKIAYTPEVIADYAGKYDAKRQYLYNLDIQDLVLREDGGFLMIAEENKQFERLGYNNAARRDFYAADRYSVDYYYEDIVLMSVHPDGRSHWQKVLPKRQYSNDDLAIYSSYFLFSNPSTIRILFNDEIRNENTVSEYVLNAIGDIRRRSLLNTDNQNLKLQIKNAVQTDDNEVFMPSVKGKKLRFVRIVY